MKKYRSGGKALIILHLDNYGGEVSASHSGHFIHWERAPSTSRTGGWKGCKASIDYVLTKAHCGVCLICTETYLTVYYEIKQFPVAFYDFSGLKNTTPRGYFILLISLVRQFRFCYDIFSDFSSLQKSLARWSHEYRPSATWQYTGRFTSEAVRWLLPHDGTSGGNKQITDVEKQQLKFIPINHNVASKACEK
jgi:hypothetical protein